MIEAKNIPDEFCNKICYKKHLHTKGSCLSDTCSFGKPCCCFECAYSKEDTSECMEFRPKDKDRYFKYIIMRAKKK
jgi:hypothetical protein